MVVVGLALTVLSFHRIFSLYMTHRRWLNAPITYMQRTCPPPTTYLPLTAAEKKDGGDNASSSTTTLAGRVCITTLTDSKSPSAFQRLLRWRNYDGILEQTWPNKARYADRHGYVLFDGSALIEPSRPPAWSKIRAVQHLLEEFDEHRRRCDWVMWTDADTVVMNSDTRIEDFLPSDPDTDFLVGSDEGGGYNSGVFVVRNSDWSRRFLQRWWEMESYVRPPGFSLSGDNNALKDLLSEMPEPEFRVKVASPPRCTFNSFAQFLTLSESTAVMDDLESQAWYMNENYYHKSDFIAHAPGYDNKRECIRLLLKEAM